MPLAHQRGMALYRAKRYGLAADEFRRELQENPRGVHTTCMLALSLSFDKQHAAALEAAWAAVEHAPNYAFAHHTLATVTIGRPNGIGPRPWRLLIDPLYEHRQRLKQAGAAEAEAIRLDPDNADYFAQAAAIQFDLFRRKAALELADRGLAVQADHVGCGNLRARILRTRGKHREAKQAVEQVLAIDPESAAALENRAWLLLQEGKPDAAEQAFADSLQVNPQSASSQSGLRMARARKLTLDQPLLRAVDASQRRFGLSITLMWTLFLFIVMLAVTTHFTILIRTHQPLPGGVMIPIAIVLGVAVLSKRRNAP